jgi:bifunctional UDP-N-acetylglucosamine pyrophosphorylase / glucosamine-1-phosphate N-acetyltransferase
VARPDARVYALGLYKKTQGNLLENERIKVNMNKNIACIILAAGKSTRMKSDIPKVLHPICGRPMLGYVLDLVRDLRIKRAIAVLGHRQEEVRKYLAPGIKVVIQKRLLGTADAVRQALPVLKNFKGTILVLYGDNPLLKKETIIKLLAHHIENKPDATLLTAQLDKPTGYGRILRDKYSSISGIAEERDADDFQKDIKEINTGIICFKTDSLTRALKDVRTGNRKKEYYLTDTIGIIYKKGGLVASVKLINIDEALGINSRKDLALANSIMQKQINEGFMQKGVTILDPRSTFINYGVRIGQDTTIYPFTVIERDVKIGRRCFIGPFAHLREGTALGHDVLAGNFLEAVRSKLGAKTLAKHFCYLGDTRIGSRVNIGAGTVTANFDGGKKNVTVIKDRAFIGSDTVLVAPVRIGRQAVIGAGSVVLKNVAGSVTVAGVPAKVLRNNKISLASKSK